MSLIFGDNVERFDQLLCRVELFDLSYHKSTSNRLIIKMIKSNEIKSYIDSLWSF